MYLRDILVYLQHIQVTFYRVSAALLPVSRLEDGMQQLAECRAELANIAALVRAQGLRLTMHLDQHIALGSSDASLVAHSLAVIEAQAALLEQLGTDAEGILVVHVGGSASDSGTLRRFAAHYRLLSQRARSRLAVEHDTHGFGLHALLSLHQHCGVPVVFDYLHWLLRDQQRLPLELALGLALATWPAGVSAEVHLSTARSEAHVLPARRGQQARVLPPRPGQHADFVATADVLRLLQASHGLAPFDIMMEAKAGDLALLRARAALQAAGVAGVS
jgi:UV DNA damage endonuclease